MRKITGFLIAIFAFAATSVSAQEYTLDKVHTYVGFKVSHMMVSNVKGQFQEYDGVIKYDPKKPEKAFAEATIKVASIDTNNEKRDNHLRSDDFFNAEKFPNITVKTKKVVKKGDKLEVTADLTIRDVTKEIKFPVEVRGPVTVEKGKQKLGLAAEITINRHDYGVKWNRTMEAGGLVVGNDVTIVLEIEADSK